MKYGMHHVHFVSRRVALRPSRSVNAQRFASVQKYRTGFAQPEFHITKASSGPATRVEPGDTIWIFGQLHSPWGSLPPALDARIEVVGVEKRRDGWLKYAAGPSSQWFPLSDASGALRGLETLDRAGNKTRLWRTRNRPVGHFLQSMRTLADGTKLISWAQALNERPLEFISYRMRDGSRAAFHLAQVLCRDQQLAVFWDRWSLPRGLTERREQKPKAALDRHLVDAIRRSKIVWGLETALYSEAGAYSAQERDLARGKDRYEPIPVDDSRDFVAAAALASARRRRTARAKR